MASAGGISAVANYGHTAEVYPYTLSEQELGFATLQQAQDEAEDQIPLIVGISTSTKTANGQAESCIRSRKQRGRYFLERTHRISERSGSICDWHLPGDCYEKCSDTCCQTMKVRFQLLSAVVFDPYSGWPWQE